MSLSDAHFLGGRDDEWSKVALWFGHEGNGLSDRALDAADRHVHVPMRGSGDSLGVSAAAPLILHERRGSSGSSAQRSKLRS